MSALLDQSGFGVVTAYVGMPANEIGLTMYIVAAREPAMGDSPLLGAFFLLTVLWFVPIGEGSFSSVVSHQRCFLKHQQFSF